MYRYILVKTSNRKPEDYEEVLFFETVEEILEEIEKCDKLSPDISLDTYRICNLQGIGDW